MFDFDGDTVSLVILDFQDFLNAEILDGLITFDVSLAKEAGEYLARF